MTTRFVPSALMEVVKLVQGTQPPMDTDAYEMIILLVKYATSSSVSAMVIAKPATAQQLLTALFARRTPSGILLAIVNA